MPEDNSFRVKKLITVVDETYEPPDPEGPLRKVASVAVIANPHAGKQSEDLSDLIAWGTALGTLLGDSASNALGSAVASYGKAAIVGLAGEQEHGVALLTTAFGDALRDAVGGGMAWISSATKRGTPGTVIDVPLAHKDALYVRDNYDAFEVRVQDAPMPDEIAVIAVVANRGRLRPRCGGLQARNIEGRDGLR